MNRVYCCRLQTMSLMHLMPLSCVSCAIVSFISCHYLLNIVPLLVTALAPCGACCSLILDQTWSKPHCSKFQVLSQKSKNIHKQRSCERLYFMQSVDHWLMFVVVLEQEKLN